MLDKLWPTVALVGTSTLLSVIFGLWIGTIAAWNRGRKFDQVSTTSTITLYSMPEWWLGLVLFSLFATGLGSIPRMFPIGGLITPGVDPWSLRRHRRPGVAPGASGRHAHARVPGGVSLIMRSSLLDEMGEDYLTDRTGEGTRATSLVRRRHATRNALLPVVTLVSLNLGFVVGGAITIETVFSIPGLGLLTTDALRVPDIPVLQGTFFFFSAAVVSRTWSSNLLYGVLDPRVRI